MKYAVVFERADGNYSAFVPDLPGCVATGVTREEVSRSIRQAINFHLEGLAEESLPIPEASAWTELVEARVS
jgi:predicted RNase H-like HicB family nuclease